jgi:spore coat polysaccharide biosynthesis predicted glycosyltransferase SpsG
LRPISKLERIDIIMRPEHPGLATVQEQAAAHGERVKVLTETPEIASRLIRCHFAVTSGSGYALELACIGVPQLMVVQTEAYWPTAQRLEEEGAATIVGWHNNVSAGSMRQAVMNLLTDSADRQAMARCGRQLIDGRGPDRLVTALEIMLHPSRMVGMGYGEAA